MPAFSGRPTAIIVGLGSGLGMALAQRFERGGFAVTGLSRDPSRLGTGSAITCLWADAADPEGLAAAIARCGPASVLIYNAYGMTPAPGPSALDPARLIEDFRVNVVGALVSAQTVLSAMRQAGSGTILFTGGGLALDPTGWLQAASLAIGKAGLRSLATTLHKELAPAGIHCGTVTIAGQIAPGTAFDPHRIADEFWALHKDPPGSFRSEIIYSG